MGDADLAILKYGYTIGKKAYYSKLFPTVEEAAAARKELERIHWGVR